MSSSGLHWAQLVYLKISNDRNGDDGHSDNNDDDDDIKEKKNMPVIVARTRIQIHFFVTSKNFFSSRSEDKMRTNCLSIKLA